MTWTSATYNGTVAGSYAFDGAVTLPAGVTNPTNVKAAANVVVAAPDLLTVSSVSAVTKNTVTVVLNKVPAVAPAAAKFIISDATATYAATAVAVGLDAKTFVVTFNGDLSAKAGTLTVKTTEDATGASIAYDFGTISVLETSVINSSQIKVKFNKALDKTAAETKGNYAVKKTEDNSTPTVDFAVVDAADPAVVYLTIGDGSKPVAMTATKSYSVTVAKDLSSASTPALTTALVGTATASDATIPQVVSVAAVGNQYVDVTFSEPVLLNTTAINTFSIQNSLASTFTVGQISGAALNSAPYTGKEYKVVRINTGTTMSAGTYYVKVFGGTSDARDTAGFSVPTSTKEFQVTLQTVPAQLSSATALSQTSVQVVFDTPVNLDVTADQSARFTWAGTDNVYKNSDGANTITKVNDKTYNISFATNPLSVGTLTIKLGTGLTDYSGQPVVASTKSISVIGTTASTISSVTSTNDKTLVVNFTQPVNVVASGTNSATTKANWTLLKDGVVVTHADLDALGHPSAGVTITASNSNKTFTFAFTNALPGGTYTVRTANLKDILTNTLTVADQTVAVTDTTPATLAASIVKVYTDGTDLVYHVAYPEAMATTGALSVLSKANYQYDEVNDVAPVLRALPTNATVSSDGKNGIIVKVPGAGTSAVNLKADLKIVAAGDLAGNPSETTSATNLAVTAAASIGGASVNVANTTTLSVVFPRALSAIDKADFQVYQGTTNITSNISAVSYTNNAAQTASTITLTMSSAVDSTQSITVRTGTVATTKDLFGLKIASNAISAVASEGVPPTLSKVSVKDTSTVRLTFSEAMGLVNAADYRVVIGTTTLTPTAAAVAVNTDSKSWDLTITAQNSTDYVPSVYTLATPQSEDAAGNKLTAIASTAPVAGINYSIQSVVFQQGVSAGVLAGDEKIVITFAQSIDPTSIKAAWNGTDSNLGNVVLEADDAANSNKDTIAFAGTNIGTIIFSNSAGADLDGVIVTDTVLSSPTYNLTGNVLTITLGTGGIADKIDGTKAAVASLTPNALIKSTGGNYINTGINATTATKLSNQTLTNTISANEVSVFNNYKVTHANANLGLGVVSAVANTKTYTTNGVTFTVSIKGTAAEGSAVVQVLASGTANAAIPAHYAKLLIEKGTSAGTGVTDINLVVSIPAIANTTNFASAAQPAFAIAAPVSASADRRIAMMDVGTSTFTVTNNYSKDLLSAATAATMTNTTFQQLGGAADMQAAPTAALPAGVTNVVLTPNATTHVITASGAAGAAVTATDIVITVRDQADNTVSKNITVNVSATGAGALTINSITQ